MIPTPEENQAIISAAEKPEGFIYRQLADAFRDATRVYGFEGARLIAAEIINDTAKGRH